MDDIGLQYVDREWSDIEAPHAVTMQQSQSGKSVYNANKVVEMHESNRVHEEASDGGVR